MHPYATNSEERTTIPFFIAAIAFGTSWLLAFLIGQNHLPFWLEVPGTFTLYTLLFLVFRTWGWKVEWLHNCGAVKVPNIEGEWHGYVTSSFDRHAEQSPVQVRISQNWTHMSLRLVTDLSESHSVVASIYVSADETTLAYQYQNVPSGRATKTMHAHAGTAALRVSEVREELSGDYYSGRDRSNHGTLLLRRLRKVRGVEP